MTVRFAQCNDRKPFDPAALDSAWKALAAAREISRAATRRRRARARRERQERALRAQYAAAWNILALDENWSTLD